VSSQQLNGEADAFESRVQIADLKLGGDFASDDRNGLKPELVSV
jgi:hypothetical protein